VFLHSLDVQTEVASIHGVLELLTRGGVDGTVTSKRRTVPSRRHRARAAVLREHKPVGDALRESRDVTDHADHPFAMAQALRRVGDDVERLGIERSTLRSETRSYAGTPFFVSTAGDCMT
jgi:hypothetical protein